MSPDQFNGCLEFACSFFLWANVLAAFRDKDIKGVSPYSTAFFLSWSFWNLWWYPYLHQLYSFLGAILVVVPQSVWLGQLIYYRRKHRV